jgi:hypothetical protein
MPGQDFEALAVALAEMARDLLAQDTLQSTLDRISEHAVELVDGCEAAGILTVRRRSSGHGGFRYTVRTLACTDDLVDASDQLQEEVGEGPCFDATRDRREVLRIADMGDQSERWPRFTPRARAGDRQHDRVHAVHQRAEPRVTERVLAESRRLDRAVRAGRMAAGLSRHVR